MIIGLHGKAGSGKDTAYQFIQAWAESQGRPVRRDAFADRLKISAARSLGYHGSDDEALALANSLKGDAVRVGWTSLRDSHFITGREFLQYYGTEGHRDVFGQDFWIDAVIKWYEPPEILVVTDVRFANEAQAILDTDDGHMWHILRPRKVADDPHASEQPLTDEMIDTLIVNSQDLDHFRTLIECQMERLVH